MKKHIYLSGALAAMAILATGCTADDPDNALNLDQTITVDDNGNVTTPGGGNSGDDATNPLTTTRVQRVGYNNLTFQIQYDNSGRPVSMTSDSWSANSHNVEYEFTYQLPGEGPSKVMWYYETDEYKNGPSNSYYDSQWVQVRYETVLDGMEFEDGRLKHLIYSKSKYENNELAEVTATGEVTFSYNSSAQLTNINVNGTDYAQVWDANGDLVEINSPYFGTSTLKYGDVVNRWAQWDPTMPLMGVFQVFGWFGAAPVHFPTEITTSGSPFLSALGLDESRAESAYTLSLDYNISWEGRLSMVRANWLLNQYTECSLDYISMK